MSINIGTGISAAFKSLAVSVLSKSDTLNSLVNRISGGSINRDTLAQTVLRDGLQMGASYVGTMERWGDQGPVVGQHVETFLLAKDTADVQASFKGLMQALLVPMLPNVAHPLGNELIGLSVGVAGDLAGALVEEQGLERTLATMVSMHGREVLADRLHVMLGGSAAGDFACNRIMEVLDHGILNNPANIQEANSKYGYTADLLYMHLSGGDSKPLENRVVALLQAAPQRVQSVLDFVRLVVPLDARADSGLSLLNSAFENQPLEKILATMAAAHPAAKTELLTQIENKSGKLLANIIDRAILSNAAFVQSNDQNYGFLADTLHFALTRDSKPLQERTVALVHDALPELVKDTLSGMQAVAGQAGQLADQAYMAAYAAATIVTSAYEDNAPQLEQDGSGAYSAVTSGVSALADTGQALLAQGMNSLANGANVAVNGATTLVDHVYATAYWGAAVVSSAYKDHVPSAVQSKVTGVAEGVYSMANKVWGGSDTAPSVTYTQMFSSILATMASNHAQHTIDLVSSQVAFITGNDRLGAIVATMLGDMVSSHADDQKYGYLADVLYAGLTHDARPLQARTVQLVQSTYAEKVPLRVQQFINASGSITLTAASQINSVMAGVWSHLGWRPAQ